MIQCKPNPAHRVVVILLCAFGLLMISGILMVDHPPTQADWSVAAVLSVFLFGPALVTTVWLRRAQIVADDSGLRWRALGRERAASWDQVSDYFDKPLTHRQTACIIQTLMGPIRFNTQWANAPALRETVSREAIQARATEWGFAGARPESDWPYTFTYDTSDNRSLGAMVGFLVACLGALMISFVSRAGQSFSLGSYWGIATVGMALFGLLPTGLFFIPVVLMCRDTRRRRKQQVTVEDDGIRYEDESTGLFSPWADVTAYFIGSQKGLDVARSYAVVTTHGTFDFSSKIMDVRVLCQVIQKYATAASTQKWRSQDTDTLGGITSQWSSGRAGIGRRVFHFRTRITRAFLWFPTSFALILTMAAVAAAYGWAQRPSPAVILILWAVTAWGWWRFYAASVQIDDRGMTQYVPFGHKHLDWAEVTEYYQAGDSQTSGPFGVVVGRRNHLCFSLLIADAEELMQEITRRAVNSRTQKWERREKSSAREQIPAEHPDAPPSGSAAQAVTRTEVE